MESLFTRYLLSLAYKIHFCTMFNSRLQHRFNLFCFVAFHLVLVTSINNVNIVLVYEQTLILLIISFRENLLNTVFKFSTGYLLKLNLICVGIYFGNCLHFVALKFKLVLCLCLYTSLLCYAMAK